MSWSGTVENFRTRLFAIEESGVFNYLITNDSKGTPFQSQDPVATEHVARPPMMHTEYDVLLFNGKKIQSSVRF
jgi:hypothetical protein